VRITHPFHPLFGQEFDLVSHRHAWSQDRVYFHNDQGRLTSVEAEDPFVAMAAGRSALHMAALQTLATLVRRVRRQTESA
jgi:Family of unknown function (DUF5372)